MSDWSLFTSSDANGNEFFGWTDRKAATARELADTFVARFLEICQSSK